MPYSPNLLSHRAAAKCMADLLWTFNAANTGDRKSWTSPDMASSQGAFGLVNRVFRQVVGDRAADHLYSTGELEEGDIGPSPHGERVLPALWVGAKRPKAKPSKKAKKAKKAKSPKRWSVRCKTGDGNWRSVASELTKGEAAREAKIYERKGYESCVFEGRRKAK